ncbi:dCTP deaminase, dUMP-forming [uncultured archaeon]|nr:dCTP deaminase, dUMP-forming [uncultured archaeon]
MTILSDSDLRKALKSGEIKIAPKPSDACIGSGSIDVALSGTFYVGKKSVKKGVIRDLSKTDFTDVYDKVKRDSLVLMPGEVVLAVTEEKLTLAPDVCGWIQGRSRFARLGLTAHVASSFIQPGSSNRQVLEVANLAWFPVRIHKGMRICQIVFEKTQTKASIPYAKRGRPYSKQ